MRTKLFPSIAAGLLALAVHPVLADPPFGASRVFATVPAVPGFPEGVAVRGNRVYVTGPANFGIFTPSAVWAYDRQTGALVDTFPITLQPAPAMKGLSPGNFGPDGRLYCAEPFLGVIIALNLDAANTQTIYATFPPPLGPSLLNELVFDDDGFLYVTDSFLATIYRVPPGGGVAVAWFTDARLAGDPNLPFGVNGIRIDRNDTKLYVSVTAENGTLDGVIYRMPLKNSPTAADLQEFHRYPFAGGPPGPDGIAFSKSGKLYVALAGASQISVLHTDGAEAVRYSGPAANPTGSPNPMPWANPANIAFNDETRSILFTNHASLVFPPDPTLFSVIEVFVNEKGQPVP